MQKMSEFYHVGPLGRQNFRHHWLVQKGLISCINKFAPEMQVVGLDRLHLRGVY